MLGDPEKPCCQGNLTHLKMGEGITQDSKVHQLNCPEGAVVVTSRYTDRARARQSAADEAASAGGRGRPCSADSSASPSGERLPTKHMAVQNVFVT